MFDEISEDEKDKMTLEGFVDYEDKRMQYNVFMTCKDLAFRVQYSPGPRGSLDPMSGLVSETKEELFFNDRLFSNIFKCFTSSATKQSDMPGLAYYMKVLKFIEKYFQVGELYMEYIYIKK